jgi:ComEC/Rec2-related protein
LTTGALLAALAVLTGILTGERLGPGSGHGPILGAVLALAATIVLARSRSPHRQVGPFVLLAVALAGVASMQRALEGLDGPVSALARDGAEVLVSARLTDDVRSKWRGARVSVRLEAAAGGSCREAVAQSDRIRPVFATASPLPGGGARRLSRKVSSEHGFRDSLGARPCDTGAIASARVLAVAQGDTASRLRLLSAGDGVVLSGELAPLRGWERGLRWRHLAARLEVSDVVALGSAPSGLLGVANRLRGLIERGTAALPLTQRALVAGFLLGDIRELPGDVAADFRASGLSHLLAVSGANVALALALAGPMLRCFGLTGRLAGGTAVVTAFAAMTRFEPSVLRASVMAGLSLLAVFLGRPAAAGRLLALAVAGLLLADPFLVHSLGFRLSVAASAGIVAWARPLAGRFPGPRPVRQALAVTTAAQLGVAPVAIPAFGGLPLAALPANLMAAPLAAALGVWGMGAGLVGGVLSGVWPDVARLLHLPTGVLAAAVAKVAAAGAALPGQVDLRQGWGLLALVALAAAARRLAIHAQQPVQRGLARTDEHQGQRPGGDDQVELVAGALSGRSDQAEVPLHLEDDGDHLGGQQEAPQAGEQTQGDEDPAHQLDDDHGVGRQLGDGHVEAADDVDETGDSAVDLAPPVVGHDGSDHQAHHQGGEVGVPPGEGEDRSHGGSP